MKWMMMMMSSSSFLVVITKITIITAFSQPVPVSSFWNIFFSTLSSKTSFASIALISHFQVFFFISEKRDYYMASSHFCITKRDGLDDDWGLLWWQWWWWWWGLKQVEDYYMNFIISTLALTFGFAKKRWLLWWRDFKAPNKWWW